MRAPHFRLRNRCALAAAAAPVAIVTLSLPPSLRSRAAPRATPIRRDAGRCRNSRLTAGDQILNSRSGTPLPNEGRLSGRIDHDDCQALRAAERAALFVRTL